MKIFLLALLLFCTACNGEDAALTEEQSTLTESVAPVETITEGIEEKEETDEAGITETTEELAEIETESTESTASLPPSEIDLFTEQGLQEYLTGEWHQILSETPVVAELLVEEDLRYTLRFIGSTDVAAATEFSGVLELADAEEKADDPIVRFVGEEGDAPAEFYLAHRTIYDEKRVLGLYHIGEATGPFSHLAQSEKNVPRELFFQRETHETTLYEPPANAEFHAVFWGRGATPSTVWLHQVELNTEDPPRGDTDATGPYHRYRNLAPGSLLFFVQGEAAPHILGDTLYPGLVYQVATDEKGAVIAMDLAEGRPGDQDYEELARYLSEEVKVTKDHLEAGMDLFITEESVQIDDGEYLLVVFGTDHEGHFVREHYYAIQQESHVLYSLDELDGEWKRVE